MSSETNQLVKQPSSSQNQPSQALQEPVQLSAQQQIQIKNAPQQAKPQKKMGCYESIWKGIIRPPRFIYSVNDLGKEVWVLSNIIVKRFDFTVQNKRQLSVECSLFEPMRIHDKPHNCVIYLHGNSSSRIEALGVLEFIVLYDMALCAFDFSGCGLSQGEYVSLGYHEQDDVEAVVNYLQNEPSFKNIKNFGLWGRSMGAVTSILASKNNENIKVLVCDSPFRNLRQLCEELAWKQYKVPRCLFSMVFCCIRRKIQEQAQFDVDRLNIVKEVQGKQDLIIKKELSSDKSILFLSANSDTLIEKQHPKTLYDNFKGYKKIFQFDGHHNSRRPIEIHHEIKNFFLERLEQLPIGKSDQLSGAKNMKVQLQKVKPKSSNPLDEIDPMIQPKGEADRIQNHTFAFQDGGVNKIQNENNRLN